MFAAAPTTALSQERVSQVHQKEVRTPVAAVTVFRSAAQIFSSQTIDLPAGVTNILFTGVSPMLVPSSIQFQAEGTLTIVSVNHQPDYVNSLGKSSALLALEAQLKTLNDQITLENTHLAVLQEEIAFLQENRKVNGVTSTTGLAQMLDYYRQQLTAIKIKETERTKTLERLTKERSDVQKQIDQLDGPLSNAPGAIAVSVNVPSAGRYPVSLSFVAMGARWSPSYDIRAIDINQPLQLTYKANVIQNTQMDWSNVQLTLSTANPQASAVAPNLRPYLLREMPQPQLGSEAYRLDELVVKQAAAPSIMVRGASNQLQEITQVARQTAIEFQVARPYTVPSDNKTYQVELAAHELAADYHYLSIPKLDKDAFLIAEVTDWDQYNLLTGEANLFFEGTYVGKTTLNVEQTSDTLSLSLGRDRNIIVEREKVQEYNRRQFIGSRQEETRGWKISVRNNKPIAIDMILLDQVPVSVQSDIEVVVQNHSRAVVDPTTGEVRWNFTLPPNEQRTFDLQYLVKFPKNKDLIIE